MYANVIRTTLEYEIYKNRQTYILRKIEHKKRQGIWKTFRFLRFCTACFADSFDEKTFWNSTKNDGFIIQILNTTKYRLSKYVRNIVCFENISPQVDNKILAFYFERCAVKNSTKTFTNKSLLNSSILKVTEKTHDTATFQLI